MPVALFPQSSRVRRVAAGALTLGALAACVVPPKPLTVSPAALPTTPPAVSLWSPNVFPGSSLPSLYFSTDRPAYASVFEVDRSGRVRVVFPRSPRDVGRVEPGKTYTAVSNGFITDRTFISAATNWRRLPFMFVVVSDTRPDLSDFGAGRSWRQQVRTDGVEAEDVIAAVAGRVTAGSGRPYATDYAYLAPQLSAREALFAASCARVAQGPQDYWYFRDLWAVFTPADPTLGLTPVFAFGPMVTWASVPYLGVAYDRAQWASSAFRGGCLTPFAPSYGYRNPLLFAAYRPPTTGTVVVVRPTTPRLQPVPGTGPTGLHVPRTPKELLDDHVRDGGPGASVAVRAALAGRALPSERLTRSLEVLRPGGLAVEPLERPARVDAPSRGGGRVWEATATDFSDAAIARTEARARVRDEGGMRGGWRSADAARPTASEPRATPTPAAPRPAMPTHEPVTSRDMGNRSPAAPQASPSSARNEGGRPASTPH